MARKGKSSEEIIAVLREYGGLKIDQARRLKELERENQRLKRAVS